MAPMSAAPACRGARGGRIAATILLSVASAAAFAPGARPRTSLAARVAAAAPGGTVKEDWAERYGGGELVARAAPFYAFFKSLADFGVGVGGEPLCYQRSELKLKHRVSFADYFGMEDLRTAVSEDFLDAGRGTTQMRSGWKMAPVSTPRGASFLEARMTYEEVVTAMEQGTVVFNSAGAHIPSLCAVSLAALDAFSFPTCLNLYLTSKGKKTSAPPHTDKQDVFVVQTQGFKRWRIYAMPEPAKNPQADPFARGKMEDTLHLEELDEPLLDVTLTPGDVLFVPAGCPHTTDTLNPDVDLPADVLAQDSVHMTVGIDTYIWGLHFAFLRGLTLLRQGSEDPALGGLKGLYRGVVNTLPTEVRAKLVRALPPNFALEGPDACNQLGAELQQWAAAAAVSTQSEDAFASVPAEDWEVTLRRAQEHCKDLLTIFRGLYTEGMAEGYRRLENPGEPIPAEKLSVFRVKPYFDRLESLMDNFISFATNSPALRANPNANLPGPQGLQAEEVETWVAAETQPPAQGEEVRVDLGGAWFKGKVVTLRLDGAYDVEYFDGELEGGVNPVRVEVRQAAPKSKEEKAEKAAKSTQLRKKQRKRKR